MLAKCPNATRLLRLFTFGKQKFSDATLPRAPIPGGFCAPTKKTTHQPPLNNVLYREQYILGADFAKITTCARPRER